MNDISPGSADPAASNAVSAVTSQPFEDAAAEICDALRELGVAGEQVGVDRLDVAALLALQRAGLRVVDDASPVTDAAREVKTPEQVKVMRFNGAIGAEMMAGFEAAIVEGVAEYELFARLSDSLLRRHGRKHARRVR